MFSLPTFPGDPSRYLDARDKSVDSVIITPSHRADVSVDFVAGDGREVAGGELAAFCAGAFLYARRGLPNEEIEVESSGEIYRVTKDFKEGKISIILPKCKVLYTNEKKNIDEIEVFVSAYSYKNHIFKLVECENAERFADANLRTILRSSFGDSIDGVAAYSVERNKAFVKFILAEPSEGNGELGILLAVATSALSKHYHDHFIVAYDGGKICINPYLGDLAVCDEELELYTILSENLPGIDYFHRLW